MKVSRFVIGGGAALAMAVALAALAFASPSAASAQVACVTATPILPSVQLGVALPVCTPITIVHSATPTITATVPATSTPVPPTPAPTQPAPTATATKPSGGTGGQVTAPNTGSGPDSGSGYNVYLLLAAGVAAALGGGSLAIAAGRARRG